MAGLAPRAALRLARTLAPAIESLAVLAPDAGIGLAGRLGELLAEGPGGWRTPGEQELLALLGPLEPTTLGRIRREIASQEQRNHALRRLLARRGLAALDPLLAEVEAGPLLRELERGGRVLVVGWHQGPAWMGTAGLARLGLSSLSPTMRADRQRSAGKGSVRSFALARDGSDAAFLKAALSQLERGGGVEIHLDWKQERGTPVEILGRKLPLAGGAVWLARRTGARLVPLTRRWLGRSARVAVTFHEPLPEPAVPRAAGRAFETALLETAARWFGAWLRANPGTLRVPRIRHLAGLPRA